jgi:ferritin-like metal-binding protein YciE
MTDHLTDELVANLLNARNLEQLDLRLLARGVTVARDERVREAYRCHRKETQEHLRLIEERLAARGAVPEGEPGTACVGALELRYAEQTLHTSTQLALSAYGFENLEIAVYHLIRREARHCGDEETAAVVTEILEEEEQMAELLASNFDRALAAALPGGGSISGPDRS